MGVSVLDWFRKRNIQLWILDNLRLLSVLIWFMIFARHSSMLCILPQTTKLFYLSVIYRGQQFNLYWWIVAFLTSDPCSIELLLQRAQEAINSSQCRRHLIHLVCELFIYFQPVIDSLSLSRCDSLPWSISHVGRQVLQRRGGERQGLAESGQPLPAAVSQHRALLQRGADGWAPGSMPLDNRSSMDLHSVWRQTYALCLFFFLPAAGTQSLSAEQKAVLLWLFRPPLQTAPLSETSKLTEGPGSRLVEIGPRYQIKTLILFVPTASLNCEHRWDVCRAGDIKSSVTKWVLIDVFWLFSDYCFFDRCGFFKINTLLYYTNHV